jgi:hypothetical protein
VVRKNNWGGDYLDALSRYDGLRSIRLTALGAYTLGLTDTYHPAHPPAADAASLKLLPNLDVVATGDIPGADRLVLSAYAIQTKRSCLDRLGHQLVVGDRLGPRTE